MDVRLLPRSLSGYIAAVDLETAVAALAPRLVAYATGRTGCRSMAEDIAQDALVALVLRWRRFGPPESPDAFVFAIAKRRAGRAVLRRGLMKPLDFVNPARVSDTASALSHERRAELQEVMGMMRRLRAADREVLLLRAAGELSLEEIASVTRSSVGAVKMRLHRARERLTELLGEAPDAR